MMNTHVQLQLLLLSFSTISNASNRKILCSMAVMVDTICVNFSIRELNAVAYGIC